MQCFPDVHHDNLKELCKGLGISMKSSKHPNRNSSKASKPPRPSKPSNLSSYLVTGAAGFIGFHLCKRLLDDGHNVAGIDNINDYYDVNLKLARLNILKKYKNFKFYKKDIADLLAMERIFANHHNNRFDVVVNLAAQPGVRYSIKNPHSYIHSNIVGFTNILECCRHNKIKHFVFASSSSVYGMNKKIPFR